jgi:hypothetical protein
MTGNQFNPWAADGALSPRAARSAGGLAPGALPIIARPSPLRLRATRLQLIGAILLSLAALWTYA